VRKWLAFPTLLFLFFYLYSCWDIATKGAGPAMAWKAVSGPRETPPQAQGQPQAAPAVPAPQTPQPERAITLTPAQQAAPVTPLPRTESGIAALFTLDPYAHTMPEDFLIGPLGGEIAEASDEGGAIRAARTFLASFAAGSVDRKLIAPERDEAIADMLAFGIEKGFAAKSFRVGRPRKHDSGEVTAAVRLFGAAGTAEGEIYLSKTGTEWLVGDFQINLAQLAEEREKPKERFFPSAYRWLLEE